MFSSVAQALLADLPGQPRQRTRKFKLQLQFGYPLGLPWGKQREETKGHQARIQDFGQGAPVEFWPQGAMSQKFAQNSFSLKIAWKLHD